MERVKAQIGRAVERLGEEPKTVSEGKVKGSPTLCQGAHCKCMNLDGQCENHHYATCVVHNPTAVKPPQKMNVPLFEHVEYLYVKCVDGDCTCIEHRTCECGLPLGHDYDHRDIGVLKSEEVNKNVPEGTSLPTAAVEDSIAQVSSWEETFSKFCSKDPSAGSGGWYVSPLTVKMFIRGVLSTHTETIKREVIGKIGAQLLARHSPQIVIDAYFGVANEQIEENETNN